jgi:glycosyltransferase involved in cell wall biosynthesis
VADRPGIQATIGRRILRAGERIAADEADRPSTPRPTRVLIVTTLFPSNVDPGHAPFNRLQFAALARFADVKVIGVVPWRGGSVALVGEETIDSLSVRHYRYLSIRGLPALNASLMTAALLPRLARSLRTEPRDVLLASYGYPDGCAGVMLGRLLGLPVVVKCHGSDLNRVADSAIPRWQLRRLLPRAQAVVVVSRHLGTRARELGVSPERLHVVYNGIDRQRFRPMDRLAARRELSLPPDQEMILYVGHLVEHKGIRDLLRAMADVRAARATASVVFLGRGPLARELRRSAAESEVRVVEAVPHEQVPRWMAAADVVCLPSWNEGMPNVVREAHACGRPVVATRVGGIPEAVHRAELGLLVPPRDPSALAAALLRQLADRRFTAEARVAVAVAPTWEQSAKSLCAVLDRVRRS